MSDEAEDNLLLVAVRVAGGDVGGPVRTFLSALAADRGAPAHVALIPAGEVTRASHVALAHVFTRGNPEAFRTLEDREPPPKVDPVPTPRTESEP